MSKSHKKEMTWADWQKLEWGTAVSPTAQGCNYGQANKLTFETKAIFVGTKPGTNSVIRVIKRGCAMYENYHYSFWQPKKDGF